MYPYLKRAFDVVASGFGLLLLAPLGMVLAAWVKLGDGGPVFFGQTRIGKGGRPFRMWKFRSMVVDAEKRGLQVTPGDDPRITRAGRFLRRTKLDELPQLLNVLRGDMSFVGPRPEVPRYVDKYTAEQRAVLDVRPGITDLATVLFRNEEDLLRGASDTEAFYVGHCIPLKIQLNLDYARRATFAGDLWILIQTLIPYWLGVLGVYGAVLSGGVWATYALLSDFTMSPGEWRELGRALPWMVGPQLACLFWQGQARGLLSYFSIPEMTRTAVALAVALGLQVGLCHAVMGSDAPRASVFLMNGVMAFFGVCGVRMTMRLLRERSTEHRVGGREREWRVAIVGTGEAATNLALDLMRRRRPLTRLVAFFDDDPRRWPLRPHGIPVMGMPECLANADWVKRLDEVLVALPGERQVRAREIVELLEGVGLKTTVVSSWSEGESAESHAAPKERGGRSSPASGHVLGP